MGIQVSSFKFQVSSFKCPSLNYLHRQVLLLLLHSCSSWNTLEVQTLTFSKPFTNYMSNMQFLLELSRKQILIQIQKSKNTRKYSIRRMIFWLEFWEIRFCKTFVIFQTLRRWDTQTWQSFKWKICRIYKNTYLLFCILI